MSQSRRVCLSVFSPDCSMQGRHESFPCFVDAGSLLVGFPRSILTPVGPFVLHFCKDRSDDTVVLLST